MRCAVVIEGRSESVMSRRTGERFAIVCFVEFGGSSFELVGL